MGFGVGQSSVDSSQRWAQISLQDRAQREQERRTKEEEKSRKQQAEESATKDKRDFGENVRRFDVGQENNIRDFTESRHRFDTETSRRDAESARRIEVEDRAFERQQTLDAASLRHADFQDALLQQQIRENDEKFAAFRKIRAEEDAQMAERKKVAQGAMANMIRYFMSAPNVGKDGAFLSPGQVAAMNKVPEFAGLRGGIAGKGGDGQFQIKLAFDDGNGGTQEVPIDNAYMQNALSSVYGKEFADGFFKRQGEDAHNALVSAQAKYYGQKAEGPPDAKTDKRIKFLASRNETLAKRIRGRDPMVDPESERGKAIFDEIEKNDQEMLRLQHGDEAGGGQSVDGMPLLDEEYALLNPGDPESKGVWEKLGAEMKREREAVLRKVPEQHRQAAEWAMDNPDNPKSKEILKRLGVSR